MARLMLNLCLTAFGLAAAAAAVLTKSPPEFGPDYYVTGSLNLPYAELVEPFQAWISGSTGKSRIDYFGGTMKTIQREDIDTSFKINPFSNEKVLNQINCFKIAGGKLQNVIPNLTYYQYVGDTTISGEKAQMWMNKTKDGKYVTNTFTFYFTTGANPRPLRFEMKGYDTLFGSHYDHYILIYNKYLSGKTDPTVFDPMSVKPAPASPCHGFPGPGVADLHLEQHSHHNPMSEYIDKNDSFMHRIFKKFVKRHAKNYRSNEEYLEKRNNFRHNLRFIHSKNRAGLSFSLAVNHMTDKNHSEIKMMLGLKKTPGYHGGLLYKPLQNNTDKKTTPKEWDWRIPGAVTQVKDQAVCGSCWSFGTTGTIEGRIFLKTKMRVRLSQQYLVDCSWGEGNDGCDGGEDFRAYKYIKQHGIPLERDYGMYKGINGFCKIENFTQLYTIKNWKNIPSGDLNALQIAIFEEGPISVGIDASHPSFAFYNQGVYYEPNCGNTEYDLDHAVLAVGYGVFNDQKYWLIKNSWSTFWGNDGYVLMSQKDNNCGVATAATFVDLKI